MRYDPDLFDDLPEVDIHDLSRNGRDSSSRNVNQGEVLPENILLSGSFR